VEVNSLNKVVVSMRITGIEEQKKNNKRCSIYVDDEYYCSVDKDILEELSLSEGTQLNEDEFNNIIEAIQYKSALRTALYMLARASKTEKEIKNRLAEKQYPEKTIIQVLRYLREINYINDEIYTESFIRSMRELAGVSRRSLYYKLAAKGIDNDIIQQMLDEAEIDDYDSALKTARKKAAGMAGSRKEKALKLFSYLYRKGFGMEICRKVIDELDLE